MTPDFESFGSHPEPESRRHRDCSLSHEQAGVVTSRTMFGPKFGLPFDGLRVGPQLEATGPASYFRRRPSFIV